MRGQEFMKDAVDDEINRNSNNRYKIKGVGSGVDKQIWISKREIFQYHHIQVPIQEETE